VYSFWLYYKMSYLQQIFMTEIQLTCHYMRMSNNRQLDHAQFTSPLITSACTLNHCPKLVVSKIRLTIIRRNTLYIKLYHWIHHRNIVIGTSSIKLSYRNAVEKLIHRDHSLIESRLQCIIKLNKLMTLYGCE